MFTFSYSRESSNSFCIQATSKYITAIFLIKEEEAEVFATKL
jgi:hypothetical protein